MKWISCFKFLFYFLAYSSVTEAREWFESYNNTRSNAMGGVKVAVSSDDTSVFRNPASLGSFRGGYLTLLDPEIETSQLFQSSFSSALTDVQKVKDLLLQSPDQFYHSKLQITPAFTVRKFSFGLIYKNELSAIVDPSLATMDTLLQNDIGVATSYTQSLFDGIIKIGATAKMINRVEVDNATLSTSAPLDLSSIGTEGSAIGFDGALQFQAPIQFLPTLAVVARDIGNLEFKEALIKSTNSALKPNKVLQSLDVGFSFTTIHSKLFRSLISFEYSDISNSRLDDFSNKRIHTGVETNWNDIFYLRFGLNQMYWTAGFEIASERISWQVATYGEEVGTKLAPKEDRRVSTKFIIRL